MAKGDILIAEDDSVLRNLYIKKFSVEGYSVRTAEDGEQALEEVNKRTPDVLILDINMPKKDGFQVLQDLPAAAERPYPVIVLTNFGDDKTKERAEQFGADDLFVKKDMTIKSLLEMSERLLAALKARKKD